MCVLSLCMLLRLPLVVYVPPLPNVATISPTRWHRLQARHRATADFLHANARRPTFQARSRAGRVPSVRGTLVTSSVAQADTSCLLYSTVAYRLRRTGRRHVHAPTPFSRASHRATFPRATSSSTHPTNPAAGRHRAPGCSSFTPTRTSTPRSARWTASRRSQTACC